MKKLLVQKNLLIQNIKKIVEKAALNGSEVIAVLKGNGYGLGMCEFARILLNNGVKTLAVSEFCEAKQLRDNGINSEIILLSPMCDLNEANEAVRLGIICAIGSEESALILNLAASQQNVRVRAHICLDTGFGRFGFLSNNPKYIDETLLQLTNVDIEGIFSHLSNSFGDEKICKKQFDAFNECTSALEALGYVFKTKHISNSCAFMRFDYMGLGAVRVGSAFLGRLPIKNTLALNRIALLESCICEIKTLPKDHNIGYANTYKTKKETKIAIIPVGYKDGFGIQKANDAFRFKDILRYIYTDIRALFKNNATYVTIKDKKCRILGRISMFNIIADISGVDANVGDAVYLECNPILIDSSVEREYI